MPRTLIPITLAALKKYAVFFKVTLEEDPSPDLSLLDTLTEEERRYQRILAKIPTLYPETSGLFLPHELNLPALHAVSFNKGCFTGQEIIARMQYRGKIKTQLITTSFQSNTPPLRGSDIDLGEKKEGKIVDFYKTGHNDYILLLVTS